MSTSGRGPKLSVLLMAVTVTLAVAVACNGGEENQASPVPTIEARPTLTPGAYSPAPGSANIFGNPGLEEGAKYWFTLAEQETVETSSVAHSGQASAYLRMRNPVESTGTLVYYLVQEVAPAEFPELISGYYRVDNWKRGADKQYLQFAVIVFAPTNLGGQYPNYQMRYPLAGISEEPFDIANAFFKFLGSDDPRLHRLIDIVVDYNVAVIRRNLEAGAEIMYMGPADANPNTP